MQQNLTLTPTIVKLLVAFFTHTITREESKELDQWICSSYENMELFEVCMDTSSKPFCYDAERDLLHEIPMDRVKFN